MLFLIRLSVSLIVALVASVLLSWTEPLPLRLGSVPAALLGIAAVAVMWLTRTKVVKGVRLSPNPLREVFVGAFGGMLWVFAMLLFFMVAKHTPGLQEAIVDRDRVRIEEVASLLEKDENWEALSKVYLDALRDTHTPGFSRVLAEQAVIYLTRTAQLPNADDAPSLLRHAIEIAGQYALPDDLPKAVLEGIEDKASKAKTEAELSSAVGANSDLTAKNKSLLALASKREADFRIELAAISKRVEKEKLVARQSEAKARLSALSSLCQAASRPDLPSIRARLAAEIAAAKALGVDVRAASAVLGQLDSAILALTPAALPSGSSARLIRVHQSPMPGLLIVDVEVSGSPNTPVLGLSKKDFVISQGNRSLTVSSTPLSISGSLRVEAVIDVSVSTEGAAIQAARTSGIEFINRLPAGTHLRVTSFSDRVKVLSDWSTDRTRAVAACQALRAEGGTALFAAVYEAIQALATTPGGHIVVFSDGANMLKGPSKEDIISAARAAKAKVHFVALKSAGYDNTTDIEAIAKGTGGETLFVSHADGLVQKFRMLAEKLNETGYRLAIFDHDPNSPLEIRIGGVNATKLSVSPNSVSPILAEAQDL